MYGVSMGLPWWSDENYNPSAMQETQDQSLGWEDPLKNAVVPREKPHTGAAAREQPQDSPVIAT